MEGAASSGNASRTTNVLASPVLLSSFSDTFLSYCLTVSSNEGVAVANRSRKQIDLAAVGAIERGYLQAHRSIETRCVRSSRCLLRIRRVSDENVNVNDTVDHYALEYAFEIRGFEPQETQANVGSNEISIRLSGKQTGQT